MSRSCHSATFSSPTWALPRSTRASPQIRSQTTGLRLCGIALEPFWPARNGSSTSRTSVRCRWRISVAKRSSPAPASAIADSSSAWRSRGTTWVEIGSALQAEAFDHALLVVRAERRPRADGARDRGRDLAERALQPIGVAVRLHRVAGELEPERRRLRVDAVRAPDAQRVRVLARLLGQLPRELARGRDEQRAGAPQLQREAGVDDVGGRQPVVDPAPRRPGRSRQHVDERRRVVVE